MARLEAAALPSETVHGTTSSRQIAQDLSNPNEKVREKIKELFGRKQPPMPKHTINKQKNRVSKPLSPHRKKVTVVCVDDKTFSIPTRKIRDKLVEGKIREMYIGKAETKSVITDKIKKLFNTASHVQFLKATSARDLLPVTFSDEDVQGDSILELIEGNSLYVRASPPAQHTSHAGSSAVQSSLPVEHGARPLVPPPTFSNTGQPPGTIQQTAGRSATQQSGSGRPPGAIQQTTGKSVTQQSGSERPPGTIQQTAGKSATQQLGSGRPPDAIQQTGSSVHQQFLVGIGRVHATVLPTPKQFNKGVLQDQLFDERWFNFLRDHSAMHQSRTAKLLEEDPPVTDQEMEEIKLKGATLLHNDFQVYQWLKWRQERGFSRLKEHGDFTKVTMDEVDQFYSFKSTNFTSGDVELPNKELLEYYMKTEKK